MKKYFKTLKKDKFIIRLFLVTFIILTITLILILFSYSKLPPLLPIFNQLPWGQDRLSITPGIFIPIILALIIFVLNIFLAAIIYEKYPLLSRLFAITSFLTSFLTMLFIIRTLTLIV
jgi:hypothetical protein